MRSKLLSLLTVIGAITVLVLAGNTVALAANGHGFLLGKSNTAKSTTTLVRTKPGPALTVKTKSSSNPPFAVNGKGKVANLNADKVDGLDAAALMGVRTKVYRYVFGPSATGHAQALPTLAAGAYLATLDVPLLGSGGTAATPTWVYCELEQSNTGGPVTDHGLVQASSSTSTAPILSSSTVLSTVDGNHVTLHCQSDVGWYDTSSLPAEVTLTKLDGVSVAGTSTSSGRVVAPHAPVR
ncbi:MAG TPA: hypothetical protein VFE15_15045 [Marmoricola sp.]|jgi:hypothetical protein|nr:hypothetical protein [Marmoricola sp.]